MELQQIVNILWTLIAGLLVFFMQAGFAMVETGFTRAKNAGNVVIKSILIFAVSSLMFFAIGFGLLYGIDYGSLVGIGGFLDPTTLRIAAFQNLTPEVFIFSQSMLCAAAIAVVSGAMAERTKFIAYLLYSAVISAVIYPIAAHWVWGGGWLSSLGFIDFSGSTAVFSVGGWAALVGAFILGPRIGKYDRNGSINALPGHSLTLGALGVFILWFGWFGLNAGSTFSGSMEMGHIVMTTNLSAVTSACTVMIITWIRYKNPDISMTLNGVLGGLVAITAGCHVVSLWGAVIIGLVAGFVVTFGIEFFDKICRVDDPVGAISVYCLNGMWGTIAVGLFADYRSGNNRIRGLFYGGGIDQLSVQALGVVAVAIWTTASCGLLFLLIKKTVGLRAAPMEEIGGLDLHEHGAEAYADFVIKE